MPIRAVDCRRVGDRTRYSKDVLSPLDSPRTNSVEPPNALAKLQGQEGNIPNDFIHDLDGRHDRADAAPVSFSDRYTAGRDVYSKMRTVA